MSLALTGILDFSCFVLLVDLLMCKFFFKVFLFRDCYEFSGRALHVVSDEFCITTASGGR